MRVIIIPSDNTVIIDGKAKAPIDLSFMSDVHAVQWYDTWGEVERIDENRRPINEHIASIEPYQQALDLWNSWVQPEVPPPPGFE